MKETQFINQNKNKWNKFEKHLASSSTDPEEIRELYTELNNDLSYAQTFYEKRTVRAYLNYLAQSVHRQLYKQKKEPFSAVWKAWTIELPLEIYRARKNLLFALILFVIYAAIGAFSTHQDIDFAKTILGTGYVNLTEENIAAGNPLGIYGDSSQGTMFVQITLNNIKVALLCFFGGILFSLGTHVILFNNAVMVGVFQYFFKVKGLLLTSFLTIWIHGAFEISAIVIASGAGFTLGHGLLFPGSYTRLQALQMSGMRGIRIMLSLIPIFVIAGFLESYVTRNYQVLPDWSKWMIVIFSFAMILFYYVVYPILVARKYPEKVHATPQTTAFEKVKFEPFKIRKNLEIFRESFQLYSIKFIFFWKGIMRSAVPMISALLIYQFFMHYSDLTSSYSVDWKAQLSILFGNSWSETYNGISDTLISILWILPIVFIALSLFFSFYSKEEIFKMPSFVSYVSKRFLKMLLAVLPLYFLMIVLPFYILIPMIFLFPFFILGLPSAGLEEKSSIKSVFKLASQKWSASLIILIVLSLTTFFFAQPFAFVISGMGDLLDWFTDFLLPIFAEISSDPIVWVNVIRQIVYVLFMILLLPLFFIAFTLLFYSAKEENEALGLKSEFQKFGKRSRIKETIVDFE
ncbi:stage II sporulation protein M [Brumimicrobium glaciale]|uniref:Stage II sporulation protein M n=1 Tax=Brumimicrobium glaciale TaxID=200475 RepID=A0A4Q4KLD7_9FLAO|nr:stage II sporulation protein M [Brumimicrobium glaciale]RYM34095.1 stage II sporulation protein M [Brumimicrobium glaciale]